MSSHRAGRPVHPAILRLEVLRTEPVGESFHRATVGGAALSGFTPQGFDQWFRLFVPPTRDAALRLPTTASKLWYAQWLAMSAESRSHCSNYTVREFRGAGATAELDIDFVVHQDAEGRPAGAAAIWAVGAREGDALGLLDQGLLFSPPQDSTSILLASDESGLPAVEGILRSLPADATGAVVIEVPRAADIRPLRELPGLQVDWVVRADSPFADTVPGTGALEAVREWADPAPTAYAFLIGESQLATGARRDLVSRGLPKSRATFCGFWKSDHHPARERAAR